MAARVDEHPHLVLVAVARQGEHAPQERARNGAQTRLRVAHGKSRQQTEEHARPGVSEAAPERHVPRELPYAQHQPLRMPERRLRHAADVGRRVLAVRIGRHDHLRLRQMVADPREARAQRGPLPAVAPMHEKSVHPFPHRRERRARLGPHRPVVDDDQVRAQRTQRLDKPDKLVVRLIRGNQDGNFFHGLMLTIRYRINVVN